MYSGFYKLLSSGKLVEPIEFLLEDKSIKDEFFTQLISLKSMASRIEKARLNGTMEHTEIEINSNKIRNAILDLFDEIKNKNEEIIDFGGKSQDEIKFIILELLERDELRKAIELLSKWLRTNRANDNNLISTIQVLSQNFNRATEDWRLGLASDDIYQTKKNKIIQDIVNIFDEINDKPEREKKIEKEKQRIEKTAASFVQESISELSKRELILKRQAMIWYITGVLSLLSGVAIGIIFTLNSAGEISTSSLVYIAIRNVLIIALLVAVSRYSFNLGKTYMNEALKNADRIHAISFGKFYLQVFGSDIKPDDLKDVFKDWNTNQESAFVKLDSSEIDPQVLQSIIKLSEALKSK